MKQYAKTKGLKWLKNTKQCIYTKEKRFGEKEIPKGNECVQFLLWFSEIHELTPKANTTVLFFRQSFDIVFAVQHYKNSSTCAQSINLKNTRRPPTDLV